jgi:WD40 repeat protein
MARGWQRNRNRKKVSASKRKPVKTFTGHEKAIVSIATFPDGKRIATGSVDKTIRIWRLEDGREMKKWVMEKDVNAIAILRDGMTGYDRTRSSSASPCSKKMRRRRIHCDSSTTMNLRRRKMRKTVLMLLYLPQGMTVHSLLDR